jgi:hypothetical protein
VIPCRAPWLLPLVLLALLLAACGDDGTVQWRDATLEVPEGWTVFEEEETRLSMANVPLGQDAERPEDRPDGDVVGMFFTHEPGTTPGKWRDFIEGREDATIETDQAIEIDGVPATQLIYQHRSGEEITREMAVVVPAREIEIFVQPVPSRVTRTGPRCSCATSRRSSR